MLRVVSIFCAAAVAVLAAAAAEQQDYKKLEGYLDFAGPKLLGSLKPTTELTLPPQVLKLLHTVAESEDPDLAETVEGLQVAQLRLYEGAEKELGGAAPVLEEVKRLIGTMHEAGWKTVLSSSGEGARLIEIMTLGAGENLDGAAGVAADDGDIVALNFAGQIDAERFGEQVDDLRREIGEDGPPTGLAKLLQAQLSAIGLFGLPDRLEEKQAEQQKAEVEEWPEYVGRYSYTSPAGDDLTASFEAREGKLVFIEPPEDNEHTFVHVEGDTFRLEGSDGVTITFLRDAEGKVAGASGFASTVGEAITFKRIE